MQIPELADVQRGRIQASTLMRDHWVCTVLIEDVDGEPMGELVTSSIRTDEDDLWSVRARSYDRMLGMVRAMGYTGQVAVTDEHDMTYYDTSLPLPE